MEIPATPAVKLDLLPSIGIPGTYWQKRALEHISNMILDSLDRNAMPAIFTKEGAALISSKECEKMKVTNTLTKSSETGK